MQRRIDWPTLEYTKLNVIVSSVMKNIDILVHENDVIVFFLNNVIVFFFGKNNVVVTIHIILQHVSENGVVRIYFIETLCLYTP